MAGNYGPNMTGFFGFAGVRDAAPTVVDVPYCEQVDAYLNCTTGNWTGEPTSYAYQWMSDGTTQIGTDDTSYVVTAGDVGHEVTCIVTATNAVGSTTAPPSNAVLVVAPAERERAHHSGGGHSGSHTSTTGQHAPAARQKEEKKR